MMKHICILMIVFLIILFIGCSLNNEEKTNGSSETTYLGLLALPATFKIELGVTYTFGVKNAKGNTYVVIIDSAVTKGTWNSISADGYNWTNTLSVNEGQDASGTLIPSGGVTSEVQLWVEGVNVKTFKE